MQDKGTCNVSARPLIVYRGLSRRIFVYLKSEHCMARAPSLAVAEAGQRGMLVGKGFSVFLLCRCRSRRDVVYASDAYRCIAVGCGTASSRQTIAPASMAACRLLQGSTQSHCGKDDKTTKPAAPYRGLSRDIFCETTNSLYVTGKIAKALQEFLETKTDVATVHDIEQRLELHVVGTAAYITAYTQQVMDKNFGAPVMAVHTKTSQAGKKVFVYPANNPNEPLVAMDVTEAGRTYKVYWASFADLELEARDLEKSEESAAADQG